MTSNAKDLAEATRRHMETGGSLQGHLDDIRSEQDFANGHDAGGAPPPSTVCEAALKYAAAGFTVFPVPLGTKKSHKKAEHSNGRRWGATNDEVQVARDFEKRPNANVGIPTGIENGIFVVEADTPEGHDVDGIGALQALQDRYGAFPATLIAKSPSGSLHFYFKYPADLPADRKIKNSTSEIAKGVDVRGEGGMVVAPPSFNPKYNGRYVWVTADVADAEVADAPRWLLDLVTSKKVNKTSDAQQKADPARVAKALAVIQNNGMNWEEWNNIGLATYAAYGGSDSGFEAFDAFSRKSSKYDADRTRERWENFKNSPPTEIGAGTLFRMADKASPEWWLVATGRDLVARMLPWRERKPNGLPVASMHNARLAITDLGIECSHDTFHDRLLFGYKDDTYRHELGEELSDNAVIRLRQIMSDKYCFDMTERHTRDAVISLALEHCFDPVCDMLDQAEAAWDGVPRLDRMAVEYFNCEDTPLNCAFMRKMMIGAAHRARVPGCKFDTIVVFESPEGWNKSSAIQELAGYDNFSDEKIIGKESREVQEQLATIWIHENADLTGMKKADIDHVKAFASRTTDIARAAYGHFVKKQKRHSIEVGTTNNREYLQSQTGNRRFWPLEVLKAIDLKKLRRDRLQLWGEAATYERAGESVSLDEALWPVATAAQEQRRSKDLWEIKLADIAKKDFGKKIIHTVGDQERVKTLTLLEDVLGLHEAWQLKQTDTMRLRNVMTALGWEKSQDKMNFEDGTRVHGYFRDRLMARIQDDPGGGCPGNRMIIRGRSHCARPKGWVVGGMVGPWRGRAKFFDRP